MRDDLISRQAAIEYVMDNMAWYSEEGCEASEDEKRDAISELINGVPAAQPELIRCGDCVNYSTGSALGAGCRLNDWTCGTEDFCSRFQKKEDENG